MKSKALGQKAVETVSPRQWIGLIVVYLSIPLVLLVCGGDFGWWQAWVYSLLIVAAGVGGRILAEQRHPGLTAERQNMEKVQEAKAWDKVLAPLMALSVSFPLVIVVGLDHRFGWSPVFPLWLIVLGLILIDSATVGHCAGLRLLVDTHSGSCSAGHSGDQNRAGRPNAAGRVARV